MKHHAQTLHNLSESIKEANAVKHILNVDIEKIKAQTDSTKALIDKLNLEYGIHPKVNN